ncbi:hypothetical protein Tco_0318989 [Tanacetum coccineum]
MAPKRDTRSNTDPETTNTTFVTNAQLQAMIDQGVTVALAARDADRNTNGDDCHNSGMGVRSTERSAHEWNGYWTKRPKTSPKRTKPDTRMKEREKPRPKMCNFQVEAQDKPVNPKNPKTVKEITLNNRKLRITPSQLLNVELDDNDDDEEFSIPMSEIYKSSLTAITPNSLITDSFIMKDEHLDTILETELDEENESSVKDLNLTPNESKDLSDIENPHHFNAESDLIESLLNRDTSIISSPNYVDTDSEPEEEIRLAENLSYDNSSPRPPEERNSEIADTIVESLSPPPIPVEDSDSLMEEIDLFLASDDSMPPGIEIDDYDSEGDIRFLEELLSNDSPPLPENESFSLDHFDDPSLPRPPPEPPDVEICFNFEPDTGVVTYQKWWVTFLNKMSFC